MRYRQNIFFSLFALLSVVILTGCEGMGGSFPKWDYNAKQERAAEAAPSEIVVETVDEAVPGDTSFSPPIVEEVIQMDYPAIKVGILLPLSGAHAELGNSMLKAAQMALFDVAHLSFELLPFDTKGTSTGAASAAQMAINDGVTLILGPVFADSVRAAKGVAQSNNVNIIAYSTDWSITSPGVFTMGFLPFDQVERIISYAAEHGLQRIGVIAPQTTYGRAIASAYKTLALHYDLETVDVLTYPPRSTNLAPEIRDFAQYDQRVRAAENLATEFIDDPDYNKIVERKKAELGMPYDAVLIAAGGADAITISNLLSQFDLTPRQVRRLGTGLFDDPSLVGEFALRDAWFAAPSMQSRTSFEARFESVYGEPPLRLASLAYDSTALAAVLAQRGLKRNGVPDFNTNAISNPNGFAGIDGIFRFLNNGTVERGLSVLTFDNNSIIEVDAAPRTFQESGR